MKLLLLGKNGQLGRELQRSLAPLGELVALDRHSTDFCGDLLDFQGLIRTVQTVRPHVIVNAAAYTAVDKAESEPELARRINALAPAVLAQEASNLGAWLIHYSTDYVFDGRGSRPWHEFDAPAPLNVYGRSKLEGEQQIARNCRKYLIFRSSWVHSTHGENFLKSILRLASGPNILRVVDDQVGSPTSARLIAEVTVQALRSVNDARWSGGNPAGLYHLASEGAVSRYAYARWIVDYAVHHWECTLEPDRVIPISSESLPHEALRPRNSRLSSEKLKTAFRIALPRWELGVMETLGEIWEGSSSVQ